jgi:hypothetical protein
MSHLQKITFVEMREMGAHDVLIYCSDHRCSHHVETTADGWGDDVRLSDIESKFTCTACGKHWLRRWSRRPGENITTAGLDLERLPLNTQIRIGTSAKFGSLACARPTFSSIASNPD